MPDLLLGCLACFFLKQKNDSQSKHPSLMRLALERLFYLKHWTGMVHFRVSWPLRFGHLTSACLGPVAQCTGRQKIEFNYSCAPNIDLRDVWGCYFSSLGPIESHFSFAWNFMLVNPILCRWKKKKKTPHNSVAWPWNVGANIQENNLLYVKSSRTA